MKLVDRMRLSIRRRAGHVVLRSELAGLGSASQVSDALRTLQRDGDLVRLGSGVYAKARRDAQTRTVRPAADFQTLAREAAAKLHMTPGSAASGHNAPIARSNNGNIVLDTGHRRLSRKLALGERRVSYINDRTRAKVAPASDRRLVIPATNVAEFVRDLASRHQVSYSPTMSDQWAETVTKLAGDPVRTGPVQDLLVALQRAGKLSTAQMTTLLVNYLRERKQRVRSILRISNRRVTCATATGRRIYRSFRSWSISCFVRVWTKPSPIWPSAGAWVTTTFSQSIEFCSRRSTPGPDKIGRLRPPTSR